MTAAGRHEDPLISARQGHYIVANIHVPRVLVFRRAFFEVMTHIYSLQYVTPNQLHSTQTARTSLLSALEPKSNGKVAYPEKQPPASNLMVSLSTQTSKRVHGVDRDFDSLCAYEPAGTSKYW